MISTLVRTRPCKKAFTLIELLVVIAIIALLLSILVPGLKASKEKAQAVVCQSNLKQWNLLVGFFLTDNKGLFPDSDWNNDGSSDPHGQWWIQPFKQYMQEDNIKILLCRKAQLHPAENYPGDDAGSKPNEFHPQNRTQCWGSRDISPAPTANKWTWASYAPNAWMMDVGQGSWGRDSYLDNFWSKRDNVTSPFNVPLFLDSRWVDVWPQETDRPDNAEYGGTGGQGSMPQLCHMRHSKMTNIVFMDGSSRRVDIKDLWGLKWHKKFNSSNPYTQPNAPWPSWMR